MGLSGTAITPVATYTPDVYPPASGTAVLAADVEATGQNLANRWAWLLAQPRVVEVAKFGLDGTNLAHDQTGSDVTATGTWQASATVIATPTATLKANDVVKVDASFWYTNAGGTDTKARILCPTIAGSPTYAHNGLCRIDGSAGTTFQANLSGWYVVTSGALTSVAFTLQVYGDDSVIKIREPVSLSATIYRKGL